MNDSLGFDPEAQAAAAARDAPEYPPEVVEGTRMGRCYDCDSLSPYGRPGDDTQNLDPCPECGSQEWGKWGVRYDGDLIPNDEIPEAQ